MLNLYDYNECYRLYLFISNVHVNFNAVFFPSLTDSSPMALLEHTPRGLYCAAGDFYVDP